MLKLLLNCLLLSLLGILTATIAKRKGKDPKIWFFVGFLLGLIGVMIAFFAPKAKEKTIEVQARQEPGDSSQEEDLPSTLQSSLENTLWYYLDGEHKQFGPMGRHVFLQELALGKISASSYVWKEDLEEWKRLGELLQTQPDTQIEELIHQ